MNIDLTKYYPEEHEEIDPLRNPNSYRYHKYQYELESLKGPEPLLTEEEMDLILSEGIEKYYRRRGAHTLTRILGND